MGRQKGVLESRPGVRLDERTVSSPQNAMRSRLVQSPPLCIELVNTAVEAIEPLARPLPRPTLLELTPEQINQEVGTGPGMGCYKNRFDIRKPHFQTRNTY
jgi:hypothetical protein